MKKIKSFFAGIGGWIKSKIFRSKIEEEKNQFKKQAVIVSIIVVVLLIILAVLARFLVPIWSGQNKPATASAGSAANPKAIVTIITTPNCGQQCWDPQLFLDALTQKGIQITKKTTVSYGWWPWSQANSLVSKYKIAKLPTIVVEFTGANKPDISKVFNASLGLLTSDGKFVLTRILAPYYDLSAKKIQGLVQITYLTDKSCAQCYDVTKHEVALKNLAVDTKNSQTIDISSPAGQALVAKYSITKVPTIIISGEVSAYDILKVAWQGVGTIASDGTYIFTNLDTMGDYYRDLTTGKIIKADPNKAAAIAAQAAAANAASQPAPTTGQPAQVQVSPVAQ